MNKNNTIIRDIVLNDLLSLFDDDFQPVVINRRYTATIGDRTQVGYFFFNDTTHSFEWRIDASVERTEQTMITPIPLVLFIGQAFEARPFISLKKF